MRRCQMPFSAPVHNDLVDVEIVQLAGAALPGWQAPNGSVRRPGPMRLGVYHQNWSGERTWNLGQNLDYPPELRPVIQGQNAQAGALNILSRVQSPGSAPRPIPLTDYALNTRTTYIGTIDANGRINTGG